VSPVWDLLKGVSCRSGRGNLQGLQWSGFAGGEILGVPWEYPLKGFRWKVSLEKGPLDGSPIGRHVLTSAHVANAQVVIAQVFHLTRDHRNGGCDSFVVVLVGYSSAGFPGGGLFVCDHWGSAGGFSGGPGVPTSLVHLCGIPCGGSSWGVSHVYSLCGVESGGPRWRSNGGGPLEVVRGGEHWRGAPRRGPGVDSLN
jgi:hypothetical protein